MDDIVPFETNDDIKKFTTRDKGYRDRRGALLEHMRAIADTSTVGKLVLTLSRGLFDFEYRARNRWPSNR